MAADPHTDLRSWLQELARESELVEVEAEVDPELELAEIHRRVIAAGGPALLFKRVKGSELPVVTNLFGTRERVERAFGRRPRELIEEAARLPVELMPPTPARLWRKRGLFLDLARIGLKRRNAGPVTEVVEREPRLTRLPATKSWPRDGGRFLTLPLVYTEHPKDGSSNLGIYRVQIYDDHEAGLHMQIGKGGGFHLAACEELGQPMPVVMNLGGPPALMLAALAPLPENVPEVLLASLLLGRKLRLCDDPTGGLPLLADAELALVGEVTPNVRRLEGPFGDHYGYYSETHDYPVFTCRAVLRKRDAVFPATVVGKPRQEDFYLGDFLQELLAPLFPLAMPSVRDLWSYGETGYHSLAAAVVRERYKREAMAGAFRILGEGQLSLTKFLLVVAEPIDLRDFRAVLTHVLERADFRTDLFLFANLSMDSLDYSGPRVNEGSKGVLLGIGEPVRNLPEEFTGSPGNGVTAVRVFSPGCLVVQGPSYEAEPECGARIAADPAFADWPLLVLSDDAERAARSSINFLWTTFTRFDPASNVHAARVELVMNHVALTPPVLIDARLKPG
ncbi:MAG: UbiD family decarboxylase, partial [Planctomycetota bacterium]|nr:UbiD family decarboxylase [Planctomycetota bacterium]